MSDRYRILHVGTGYTGSIALGHILQSPRLELVGHLVHSVEKVGCDSGELAGKPAVGVVATDRLEDLLGAEADCVTYFAATSGRELDEVVDQLCAILASGKNVVTPSHPALFHPPSLDHTVQEKLWAACDHGESSLFATGIAPGFASDMLAIHAATMTELPERISVEERIPCGAYRVPGFFAMLGFGRTTEQDADVYPPGAMIGHIAPSLRLLAQGVGLVLSDIREYRDVAIADRSYSFAAGEIPAGTIASVRMRFEGIVDGRPRLHFSSIWSMPEDPVDDWQPVIPAGSATRRLTRITIDGNPPVQVEFALVGGELPGSAATAARVVNAIPAVCAADPGVLSGLDIVVAASASPA